jgi:outer membrane protein
VNRLFKWIVAVGIATAVVTAGVPAAAQAAAGQPTGARVAELVAQARQAYNDGLAKDPVTAASSGTQAGEVPTLRLTVDEAVGHALKNNIELSVERMNPEVQELALELLKASYRPTLTSLASMNSNNPLPTSLLNGGTKVKNETLNLNAGLTQSLPWHGSSYTFTWNNPRTNTTSSHATLNPQYAPSMTATFKTPLWRNGEIDSTRQALWTARVTRAISDLTLRSRVINTEANTRNAYWDYVYAVRAVEAARQSVALADKLVSDNKVRVEVGTLAPLDVVQAQAEAATRRQSLASAEATRLTAELTLKRLLVSNTDDPMWKPTIVPTSTVQLESRAVDLEGAVKKALTDRTDLVTARKQLESNDLSIRYLRNQMRPALDATLTYGTRGLGGDTFVFTNGTKTSTIPGGYSDAIKALTNFDYPTWTIQFDFSYPLGKSAQEASFARAKVQYGQAQAQIRALELTVATEVTNAALSIQSAQKTLEAAQAARTLAQKKLDNEQTKYEVGMQTNYFVVQAQRDLLDSQITELRASLNYQKALVEFERLQVTATSTSSVTSVTSSTAR